MRVGAGLSIRSRLTLWYTLIVFVSLISAGLSVLWLQARLGLARIDAELTGATVAAAGVLRTELNEGLSVEQGVQDVMDELNLSDEGFAVVTASGSVLGSKIAHGPGIPTAAIASAGATPITVAAGTAGARIRAADFVHHEVRVRIVAWTSLAPLQAERRTLERAMLIGIPLAVLLSGIGGLSIGRRSLQPLAEMAEQSTRIGIRDLDVRLSTRNPSDELGTLARAFNGLLDRLGASIRQQRAFMADASHQVRTPVSVIRTAAQVALSQPDRSVAEYRESLALVARQAQRLTKMVDDMFMLAMADADARPLQIAPLYLDEVIDEVVDDIRPLGRTRQITLRSESGGETPFVGDEHLLRQLVTNLLENAIRHTPPHGTVTVALTRADGALRLQVADTGGGIGAGDVDRIFERFVRLGPAGSESGGGLGLPIARWIAEAHGGTLVLESTGPDGSRFLLTVPSSAIHPAAPTLGA